METAALEEQLSTLLCLYKGVESVGDRSFVSAVSPCGVCMLALVLPPSASGAQPFHIDGQQQHDHDGWLARLLACLLGTHTTGPQHTHYSRSFNSRMASACSTCKDPLCTSSWNQPPVPGPATQGHSLMLPLNPRTWPIHRLDCRTASNHLPA